MLDRREFLATAGVAVGSSLRATGPAVQSGGETLYNGIRLLTPWPPPTMALSREPMKVPYLDSPPAVIPIDVGRQLFVDDFLIESVSLKRTYHRAKYHAATPVLKPDQPWEITGRDPCAMVFSDGVWYDPQDKLFKMWYMGGIVRTSCYATSKDGIHWNKPQLDVVIRDGQRTNIVQEGFRDSVTVWLDLEEKDLNHRYKLFRSHRQKKQWGLSLYWSPDGIHWGEAAAESGPCGDRTTVFYNPFRKVWIYSIRADCHELGRVRSYRENADVLAGARWQSGEPVPWVGTDKLDPQRDDLKTPCQLYNLDGVAYESLMIGLFTIWRGQPRDRAKPNELCIGYSRDGFHWHRPDHRPFIPVSENHGAWNWGNVQSAGGGCLLVGDRLYFYVSGRAGIRGSATSGVCTTGLAVLRRDGFASMDAGETQGALTTRPVTFRGKYLFVNIDDPQGELRVEVLDRDCRAIRPFTSDNCVPVRADRTLHAVHWKGANDLSNVAGKPVKLRFHLKNGRIYAFWVSSKETGASHGYVAAGGPGLTGPTDTVGSAG